MDKRSGDIYCKCLILERVCQMEKELIRRGFYKVTAPLEEGDIIWKGLHEKGNDYIVIHSSLLGKPPQWYTKKGKKWQRDIVSYFIDVSRYSRKIYCLVWEGNPPKGVPLYKTRIQSNKCTKEAIIEVLTQVEELRQSGELENYII